MRGNLKLINVLFLAPVGVLAWNYLTKHEIELFFATLGLVVMLPLAIGETYNWLKRNGPGY